jgi:hypothetical protein
MRPQTLFRTPVFLYVMNEPNKLECYLTLGRISLPGAKQSILLGPLVSYEESKCCEWGPRLFSQHLVFYVSYE